MATQAQSIITRAQVLLQDDGTRWPGAELLYWVSEAQREAVLLNPALNSLAAVLTLVDGARQQVTGVSGFFALLDVSRNMAADGVTPGATITVTPQRSLDAFSAAWQTKPRKQKVVHYCYDPAIPQRFMVYPPAAAGVKVEIIYSATPAEVTNATDVLVLPDIISAAIVNYVCFRAFSKDAEFGENAQKASAYYQMFSASVAATNSKQLDNNPNREQAPFDGTALPVAK